MRRPRWHRAAAARRGRLSRCRRRQPGDLSDERGRGRSGDSQHTEPPVRHRSAVSASASARSGRGGLGRGQRRAPALRSSSSITNMPARRVFSESTHARESQEIARFSELPQKTRRISEIPKGTVNFETLLVGSLENECPLRKPEEFRKFRGRVGRLEVTRRVCCTFTNVTFYRDTKPSGRLPPAPAALPAHQRGQRAWLRALRH